MTMETYQQKQKVVGPVDFLVVKFPGNKFTGTIAPEIHRLQDEGIVRIIDFLFIRKDEAGNVEPFEVSELGEGVRKAFEAITENVSGEWFSQNDVDIIGAGLPNGTSAGAILYENTWAVRLVKAFMENGAEVLEQGRITADRVDQVFNERISPGARG
jgi:hypothetical protein